MTPPSSTSLPLPGVLDGDDNNELQHPHNEVIYVLYGSQTGNSEQAAHDFCRDAAIELHPDRLAQWRREHGGHLDRTTTNHPDETGHSLDALLTSATSIPSVTTVCLSLDDFLELRHAPWTRIVVIYCSSYGTGQAPLGAYRFRDLCDYWLNHNTANGAASGTSSSSSLPSLPQSLEGVHYALCGLGDSKYRTFFQNPTVLDRALTLVGAQRLGIVGCADASTVQSSSSLSEGDPPAREQGAVIAAWTAALWEPLRRTLLTTPPLRRSRAARMQRDTVAISTLINPDYTCPPQLRPSSAHGDARSGTSLLLLILRVLLVVVAAVILALTTTGRWPRFADAEL